MHIAGDPPPMMGRGGISMELDRFIKLMWAGVSGDM